MATQEGWETEGTSELGYGTPYDGIPPLEPDPGADDEEASLAIYDARWNATHATDSKIREDAVELLRESGIMLNNEISSPNGDK